MGSFALDLFLGHRVADDEVDKAVAVFLGRNRGDLGLWIRETFPEMLESFDDPIL